MHRKDEELILEYQYEDNKSALEELFSRYKSAIFNFCLRILANRADAEDVTSDVFLKLFAKKYVTHSNAKFSTWLYKIARNTCIDKIRTRKKMISMWFSKNDNNEYEEWDVADPKDLQNEDLIKRETAIKVRKAIVLLPIELREALILREYQKLSYQEISDILGCTLENVKIQIFRAREHLRNDLSSLMMEGNNE